MIFHRHNRCVGITLFRFRRRQLEVWFCPKHEIIESHSHRNLDSRIYVLLGVLWGRIGKRYGYAHRRRAYPVGAGIEHSAITMTFCIFANWETWKERNAVTSAAIDFEGV